MAFNVFGMMHIFVFVNLVLSALSMPTTDGWPRTYDRKISDSEALTRAKAALSKYPLVDG